jgi:phage-related protein
VEPGFWKSSKTIAGIYSGAVYTMRFAGTVYVLHAFQKKSKKGAAMPKMDLQLIEQRLHEAEWIVKGRNA